MRTVNNSMVSKWKENLGLAQATLAGFFLAAFSLSILRHQIACEPFHHECKKKEKKIPSWMFPKLLSCVNGQESKYPYSVNTYESGYSKIEESKNFYKSAQV